VGHQLDLRQEAAVLGVLDHLDQEALAGIGGGADLVLHGGRPALDRGTVSERFHCECRRIQQGIQQGDGIEAGDALDHPLGMAVIVDQRLKAETGNAGAPGAVNSAAPSMAAAVRNSAMASSSFRYCSCLPFFTLYKGGWAI